jgi:uncharacterized protein YegL
MEKTESRKSRDTVPLKGQFRPSVFLLNGTPGSPDSWAKAVLNIDSNSRSNSIRLDDEESIFLLDCAKL